MAAQAAHLVDSILPAVPIRQFVLSFPFELSLQPGRRRWSPSRNARQGRAAS